MQEEQQLPLLLKMQSEFWCLCHHGYPADEACQVLLG